MDLATPIYKLSNNDIVTLDDCTCGTLICGSTGSGKSSGSGKHLALSFLKKGFGGLVLTAKNDEKQTWIDYATKTGRLDDLIIFSPSSGKQLEFNPFLYEMQRSGEGGGETENLAAMFTTVMKMNGRVGAAQSQGSSQDPFWDYASERLIKAAINVIKLSGYKLTMTNLIQVISDAPFQSGNENTLSYLETFIKLVESDDHEDRLLLESWSKKSFTVNCLVWAYHHAKTNMDRRIADTVRSYFLNEFSRLGDKTRTGISEQLYSFVDPFRSGLLAESFTEDVSPEILPEQTFMANKIILLDFPPKKYLNVGVISQALYKYVWQQAIERRDINKYPNPVFLWMDEAHLFANKHDAEFQTTARSSKACTVMITQNLSNFYATIGGSHARDSVHSLIGNLATKIFHANDCPVTNNFAAEVIGQTFQSKDSFNYGHGQAGGSFSKQKHNQVEPITFTMLRRGGASNDYKVDAVITCTGKTFSNKRNFIKTVFNQNIS